MINGTRIFADQNGSAAWDRDLWEGRFGSLAEPGWSERAIGSQKNASAFLGALFCGPITRSAPRAPGGRIVRSL